MMKKGPCTFWTKEELDYLKYRYEDQSVSYAKIAEEMGVNKKCLVSTARRYKFKRELKIKRYTSWNEEECAEIRNYWEDTKLTAEEIGKKFSVSKSSIIGLAHKRGWKSRRKNTIRTTIQINWKPSSSYVPEEYMKGRKTGLELKPNECHCVVGNPKDYKGKIYCGKPVYKGCYCKEHSDKFFVAHSLAS